MLLFAATADKAACTTNDLPGFSVPQATSLSRHEYDVEARSCIPGQAQSAATSGKIFVISSGLGGASFAKAFGMILGLIQYEGLPIKDIADQGLNHTDYLCFQMAPDADIDPLRYFHSASVEFPVFTKEIESSAPNCAKAIGRLEGFPDSTFDEKFPAIDAFRLVIRASSHSLGASALKEAFAGSLNEAGLPQEISPDGVYHPLQPGDQRPLVVESITPTRIEIEAAKPNAALCTALLSTMTKTEAFISPPDDQTPTIVLKGTTGGPPPRYQALDIQLVASPQELCNAIQPAFERWAVAHPAQAVYGSISARTP